MNSMTLLCPMLLVVGVTLKGICYVVTLHCLESKEKQRGFKNNAY